MRFVAAVFMVLFSTAALPQEVNCINPTSQFEMTECAFRDADAADALLNEEYRRAIKAAKAMDADFQPGPVALEDLLREAQRAWIPYRDAACSVESGLAQGGTAQNQFFAECLRRLTSQRIDDLRNVSGAQ